MNDSMDSGASRPTIAPRRMRFDFGSVPRYWMRGRRFETHFFNSLNALLPPGEHVFVRVCASMLAHVDDPQLARDVRGFVAQESSHASSHLRMIPHLESQGFPLRSLLEGVEHRSERGDRMFGPRQQLALIAGVEHFTAILGAWAFERGVFEDADPVVRDLFLWHAAEEIERKCVAFDLLQAVRPGYWARVLGLTGALFALCAEWTWCTIRLIHSDPEVTFAEMAREAWRSWCAGRLPFGALLRGSWRYLQPSFHPGQEDNLHLAQRYFAGRAVAPPTSA